MVWYRMTREEREEAYNRARERIFGNMEKKEGASETDDNNGVSRASSVSAKEKAGVSKRKPPKQRRDDSESFDSRSNYIAYCGPQQPAWGGIPQYIPIANAQYNVASPYQQQQYSNPLQPIYGPNQSYPAQPPNNGYAPSYNQVPMPNQVRRCVQPCDLISQLTKLTVSSSAGSSVGSSAYPRPSSALSPSEHTRGYLWAASATERSSTGMATTEFQPESLPGTSGPCPCEHG